MSSKILPITDNVDMYSFTYYSYPQAILKSPFFTGKKVASLKMDETSVGKWRQKKENIDVRIEDQRIAFFSKNKYNYGMNGVLFREVGLNYSMELQIEYQQYTNPWGCIGIGIYQIIDEEWKNNSVLEYGQFNNGKIYIKDFGIQHEVSTDISEEKNRLRICKEGNKLECYLVNCNKKEEKVYEKENVAELYIGVFIKLYDNCYYDFLFQNNLQLKYDCIGKEITLDYDSGIMKNDNYFTADYFFDYSIESVSTIKRMGISIISYITGKISNGVYLEMEIDYFLLPNSVCYSVTHYYHRSLIYGYDSEKKKFNVIYTEKGKLIIDSIGYGDFITQMQKKDSHVMSIAFMPENIGYEFSIEVFKRNLESYRQGESVVKTDIIRHSNSYVYGMELYNVILKKDGLQTFIEDIRISYLFFEHKEIMYKRLRYLKEKKYIKSQKFDCIITNALDICNESKKIMQLCMKEAFSSKHENKEKIKGKLVKIRNEEENLFLNIIKFFTKENDYKLT